MAKLDYIRCPKCGFQGQSVHYFKMHTIEVIIAAMLTAMMYFIINLITNPRACPQCGNHRSLQPLNPPAGPTRMPVRA